MTKFGTQNCVYGAVGNPTTYLGKTATWKGRQLTCFNGNAFTYDGQGRRISKNNITFTYDSNGNLLKQSNGLEFIYDNSGVIGVKYNSVQYFYRRDAQGNIIAILDSTGNVVVEYKYGAWGNHEVIDTNGNKITVATHIGNLNPFRYRGYYYDTETELYYLQTRYYDPEVGRFISRDSIEYADPETINGLNLYAYCGNNPVMGYDPTGTTDLWEWVLGAIIVVGLVAGAIFTGGAVGAAFAGAAIGGAISYCTQLYSGELNWAQFALDIGVGALTGAIGASGLSKAAATVLGGVIGSGSSIASDLINDNSVNWGKAALSGIIGVGAGFLGGAGVRNTQGLSSSIYKGFSNNLTAGIISFAKNNSQYYFLPLQYRLFSKAIITYAGSTIVSNIISGVLF